MGFVDGLGVGRKEKEKSRMTPGLGFKQWLLTSFPEVGRPGVGYVGEERESNPCLNTPNDGALTTRTGYHATDI